MNDKVVCQICGFESGVLSKHIASHGINAEEYHKRFPGFELISKTAKNSRNHKYATKEKKPERVTCKYCNYAFNGRIQRRAHERLEEDVFLKGIEGIDFLSCKECGYRALRIDKHIKEHGLTKESYEKKHGTEKLIVEKLIDKLSKIRGPEKDADQYRDSEKCHACGEWYRKRFHVKHYRKCIADHPDKYQKNIDYVSCPECNQVFLTLGKHLKNDHGWDNDKIAVEKMRGLELSASKVTEKRNKSCDFEKIKNKREKTNLERYGIKNIGNTKESREKSRESSLRRYGTEHPMHNEEVLVKQTLSAKDGPSGLEKFFIENVCSVFDEVVYTGYGARIIHVNKPVEKHGKQFYNLNPDFMIFKEDKEEAKRLSQAREKMDGRKFTSKYVIELLGDYYHSEDVIGVDKNIHEKQIVEAYASSGISCLVLWEGDVLGRWNEIRDKVCLWIKNAVVEKDKRKIETKKKEVFVCPVSGKEFVSERTYLLWLDKEGNYWKEGKKEGLDFVVCMECGDRFGKLGIHLKKTHGMGVDEYLEKYPNGMLVSENMSKLISNKSKGLVRGSYNKHVAYKLPDGRIVRKKDAWLRAYENNPPEDTKVKAGSDSHGEQSLQSTNGQPSVG